MVCGLGNGVQLVGNFPTMHELLDLSPAPHILGVVVQTYSQVWGGSKRWIPGTSCSVSLAYLASSRPVKDYVLKKENPKR